MSFAVVIPTLNPGPLWDELIKSIKAQSLRPDLVLIIDSGSIDGCREKSENEGFHVISILKSEFDHAATRQFAIEQLQAYEYVIFLTQDALPATSNSFKNLLMSFQNDSVAAVCGRQLPREKATAIVSHARIFNYPDYSYIRSYADRKKYGLKTAFLSNSYAAYRLTALREIGGFSDNVIFGEDMVVAVKLLKAGYIVAYTADACVYHSHDYSLWLEMKRYFDMGVFHAREPWIRHELGGAEGEGIKFVVSEFKYLLNNAFWRIPEGMLRTLFRYTGFRFGLMENRLPLWLKRILAMNKGYFKR